MTCPARRRLAAALCVVAITLAIPQWLAQALAQTYPAKPIRLIAPYPPGGGVDTVEKRIPAEISKWAGVIKGANLKLD